MKRLVMCFAVLSCLIAPIAAQQPPTRRTPGPDEKRLDFFVGHWNVQGENKPTPMGPGGKFSGKETAEWFPGNLFVVSHSEVKGSTRTASEQSEMGYNPDRKVYTYHMISSEGEELTAEGTVSGKTWTWTTEGAEGGKPYKGRMVIEETSPTTYTMKFSMSMDGGPFMDVMEGTGTKTK